MASYDEASNEQYLPGHNIDTHFEPSFVELSCIL